MRRSAATVTLLVMVLAGVADAAPAIEVEIGQDHVDAVLGETHVLEVTIRNEADRPTGPLLGHLVVVDPGAEGSADAEDWTDTLTVRIAGLDPGESSNAAWNVTPISAGKFLVMVVVAPEDPALGPGVSANTVFDVVQSAGSLQASVLPIAIAGPLVVGGFLGILMRRERRRVERLFATV